MIGSFCPKHIIFQLENFIMTLKCDAKFKWKLTCGLKGDTRNLVNFHASSRKSEKLHFDGLLLPKTDENLDEEVQKSYVSLHRRIMQSLKKNWRLVPKMTLGLWWILMRAVASLTIYTLMCYFCRKYIMFQPKKCRGVISHNTEKWCKIWGGTNLCFEKWYEEFLIQHSKVSKLAL